MQKVTPELRAYYGEGVTKGAKLLDRILPGWAKHIKLNRLDMDDVNMCMLGQLFGRDTEMALAKEMYPEEYAKYETSSGYSTGLAFFRNWVSKALSISARSRRNSEYMFLHKACAGAPIECLWAEQIAERLAKEEGDNGKTKATGAKT